MDIVEMSFSAASNLLSIYTAFRLMKLVILHRRNTTVLPAMIYFPVWFINWIVRYFVNSTALTTASLLIGMFFAAQVLYEGSLLRKLVAVVMAFAIGIVSENIVWIALFDYDDSQMKMAMESVVSSFVIMVIVLILERFIDSKKSEYISLGSYINIFVIILGSIALGEILIRVGENNRNMVTIGMSIICLIDVSTYYVYDKVNEAYLQRLEQKITLQRAEMYKNQLDIMQRSQKDIRALNHDMKNHLLMLQSYIDRGQCDKAVKYIQDISDCMLVPDQYISTGNQEVDIILNYKLAQADELGCSIDTQIQIPDTSFMESMDLNTLIGNLLDNSLEALGRTNERRLYVGLKYSRGVFAVKIENTYDGILIKNGESFSTSKKDIDNHGIGIMNVDEIIAKYGGSREVETDSGLFSVKVMLYVNS